MTEWVPGFMPGTHGATSSACAPGSPPPTVRHAGFPSDTNCSHCRYDRHAPKPDG